MSERPTIYRGSGALQDMLVAFFFQAEDGIRDFHVTGVQTCALPISRIEPESGDGRPVGKNPRTLLEAAAARVPRGAGGRRRYSKIGRASCRERAEIPVGTAT